VKGMYNSNFNAYLLDDLFSNINFNDNTIKTKLARYNCFVYNITKNKIEIINGLNPKISEYIYASCCCWGLLPPVKIIQSDGQTNEFMDCGFIQVHPFENLLNLSKSQKRKNKKIIKLLLTTNTIHNMKNVGLSEKHDNLITYLTDIISYLIDKNDYKIMDKMTRKKNAHIIQYLPRVSRPNDFDPVQTKLMISDGKIYANNFINNIK